MINNLRKEPAKNIFYQVDRLLLIMIWEINMNRTDINTRFMVMKVSNNKIQKGINLTKISN